MKIKIFARRGGACSSRFLQKLPLKRIFLFIFKTPVHFAENVVKYIK